MFNFTSHAQKSVQPDLLNQEITWSHKPKTRTSGEPSQEWPADPKISKIALNSHLGGPNKALQASLASSVGKIQLKKETKAKKTPNVRTSADWKQCKGLSHICQILMILKTFGKKKICRPPRQKKIFLWRCVFGYIWCKTKTAFQKKYILTLWSNAVVVVWWSGAALFLQDLEDLPILLEIRILLST